MTTQDLSFRPIDRHETTKIVDIENECFDYDQVSKKSFDRFFRKQNSDLILMEKNGENIGYGLILYRKNSKKARLYSLAIKPEYAGCGYGKQLLSHLETCASNRQSEVMVLEVASKNEFAQNLYKKFNYQQYKVKKQYYTNNDDAICMKKELLH